MQINSRMAARVSGIAAAVVMLAACGSVGNTVRNEGVVRAVVSAPVAPDGMVAGRTTDIVINLDASPDPALSGFTLRKGDRIRVTLPAAFKQKADLPLLTIFDCIAAYPQCDTVVPLKGWPQGALGAPAPLGYVLSREGAHTFVVTATEDFIARPPDHPGLKQVHLLLNSLTNPPPGHYPIGVELLTAEGKKHGTGRADIRARARPAIAVTNAFHDGFANGNYQQVSPGARAPLPFDLLLWDRDGAPMDGVEVDGTRLVRGNERVGRVSIDGPAGATGQDVFANEPSALAKAPVTGIPAGHLRTFFRAGSVPGESVVRFELDGGDAERFVVRVR